MSLLEAVILGVVEGLTEFLPVSSTGHLILTSHWLGLEGESVKTFEVVIQVGALAAVLGLYRTRVASMARGLMGQDAAGWRLAANLCVSFLPAMLIGLALRKAIKAWLFGVTPVVWALALGGVALIVLDRFTPPFRAGFTRQVRGTAGRGLETLTAREALLIGVMQCLAFWPGTSRALVTMAAGMWLGFSAIAAAEYSFLLALPTLAAAALLDLVKGGDTLLAEHGLPAIVLGLLTAALVAALAIKGLIRYLTTRGMALFGWYRLALAALVWWHVIR